jgi:hypothetical protein
MPAIHYDFDRSRNSGEQVRLRKRGWCSLRNTRRSPPLEILVIKTLSMIAIRESRVYGSVKVKMWETWRRAARQQDAQRGNTHKCGMI